MPLPHPSSRAASGVRAIVLAAVMSSFAAGTEWTNVAAGYAGTATLVAAACSTVAAVAFTVRALGPRGSQQQTDAA